MKIDDFLCAIEKLSEKKPHKCLLLLAVIDLIRTGGIIENKIYFDEKLREQFTNYFNLYARKEDRNRPHTPFFHLRSSGFWNLAAKEGKKDILDTMQRVGGAGDITTNIDYAFLNEEIYDMLNSKNESNTIREFIQEILVDKYGSNTDDYIAEPSDDYVAAAIDDSLFKHEEKAISNIRNLIHNKGIMLNNVLLHDEQSNNYYEYDVILISHSGIYVVELKHWSGHVQVGPYQWTVNETQYRNDPHKSNGFKCKVLKGLYQHRFRTYPNIWVESVVVLTNPDAIIEGASSPGEVVRNGVHNPTFASIEDFISYIRTRNKADLEVLTALQIEAIASYLQSLIVPKKGIKYNIPGYETVEYLDQKKECIELLARPTQGGLKGLYRFRVFRLLNNVTQSEKERFLKKAYNTINAVSTISDHPNIHKVWVFENDEGDIIEGSEWSDVGTLRDLIQKKKEGLHIETALGICQGIVLGLNRAHQEGIIHRAIKPENILMLNNIPKLLNFDLSYQTEDNHITVITDSTQLEDDGYIAPELLLGGDIDEGTDFFGLGLIAYELLAGMKPFSKVRKFLASGGKLSDEQVKRLRVKGVSNTIVDTICDMVIADLQVRLKNGEAILTAFGYVPDESRKDSTLQPNAVIQPGTTYDVYEIISPLGQGVEAQIYRARTIRGQEVALKLFNREIPRERIFQEAEITSAIQSAYVVSCDNKIGHWNNDRYFIVLNYIDGQSMRDLIDEGERPKLEMFRTVALGLMEGVASFHNHIDDNEQQKAFLHSDIKPDNIIITKDGKAVLIDCGIAGEPRVDVFQGSINYVPPDNIRGADMEYSEDGDLFALGVSLWEWVYGKKPYEIPVAGDEPETLGDLDDLLPENIQQWLKKAVATEKEQRFSNVKEMQSAFTEYLGTKQKKDADKEDENKIKTGQKEKRTEEVEVSEIIIDTEREDTINPFLPYLNSLSNASAANENAIAESQVGNQYFERIRVDHPVSDLIFEQLITHRRNVILTGNAGDGKTTIAAEIIKRIEGKWRVLSKREKIESHKLIIIKDMSELEVEERKRLFPEAFDNHGKRYLIVSNSGILLENLKNLNIGEQTYAESDILRALEADDPQCLFEDRFILINLGQLNNIVPAVKVFAHMIKPENWHQCEKCSIKDTCAVYCNIQILHENQQRICERVTLLYRRLYEYGDRLTMRQMTGHLAYAITAGLDCAVLHTMSVTARSERLNEFLFFNRIFGDDGSEIVPEAEQLFPVRQIRKTNFGVFLDPAVERAMGKQDSDSGLKTLTKILYNRLKTNKNITGVNLRSQLRRFAFFFAPLKGKPGNKYISIFLKSPMLIPYIRYSSKEYSLIGIRENNYRRLILQVLQEYFAGIRLPEGTFDGRELYITLNPRTGKSATQMILQQVRAEDFSLAIKPTYTLGNLENNVLCIDYKEGNAQMIMDLPFLDYVARRYQGEVAEELSAFYSDRLEQFKIQLLNYNESYENQDQVSLRLLRITADRQFQVMSIRVVDDHLEVIA